MTDPRFGRGPVCGGVNLIATVVAVLGAPSVIHGCAEETGGRDPGGPAGKQPGDDDGSTGGSNGGSDSGDPGSGNDDDDGDDGDDGDGGAGSSGGVPQFDVSHDGPGEGGGDGDEDTCKKVDLLFVIDNSGSMSDNQTNLVNSFPGFAMEIRTELDEVLSYHVGVVTSDAYFNNAPGCTQMGALVTQTGGANANGQVCTPFADGGRYMTENDDLATKFACVGKVGTSGNNDEHQVEAAIQGISPALNMPGACNEGFIRDDALLVLVFITDEDDGPNCNNVYCLAGSPGLPQNWFDNIVGIKGNIETNIAVVSLLWGMPANVCGLPQVTEHIGTELRAFTEMFTFSFIGDVCSNDYSPTLHDAVSLIDSACAGFKPPE